MTARLIPLDHPEKRLLNYDRADWLQFYLTSDTNPSFFEISMSTAIFFYVALSEGNRREVLNSIGYPPGATGTTLVVEISVGTRSYKIRDALGVSRILECIREDNRNS